MGALDPGLDRLRQELIAAIQSSEERTARRFDALEARIARIDGRFDGIDDRFDGIDDRIHGIDGRIDASAAETRRHFDVVAEALRSDVILVIEGLAMLDEKTERFHGEVREEFRKVDHRFLRLEARVVSALEGR
jgi:hypothetical protein